MWMAVFVATQFQISQISSFISMYLNTEKSVPWKSIEYTPTHLAKSDLLKSLNKSIF